MKTACLVLVLALCAISEAKKLKAVPKFIYSTSGSTVILDLDGSDSLGDIDTYTWKLLNGFDKGREVESSKVKYTTDSFLPHKWKLTVCDEAGKCKSKVIKTPDISDMKLDPPSSYAIKLDPPSSHAMK